MVRRGEWVTCVSCFEESMYVWRDPQDFACSVCGGHGFEVESETVSFRACSLL
jgi:hypothetical protein